MLSFSRYATTTHAITHINNYFDVPMITCQRTIENLIARFHNMQILHHCVCNNKHTSEGRSYVSSHTGLWISHTCVRRKKVMSHSVKGFST